MPEQPSKPKSSGVDSLPMIPPSQPTPDRSPERIQEIRHEHDALETELRRLKDAQEANLAPYEIDGRIQFGNVPSEAAFRDAAFDRQIDSVLDQIFACRSRSFNVLLAQVEADAAQIATLRKALELLRWMVRERDHGFVYSADRREAIALLDQVERRKE